MNSWCIALQVFWILRHCSDSDGRYCLWSVVGGLSCTLGTWGMPLSSLPPSMAMTSRTCSLCVIQRLDDAHLRLCYLHWVSWQPLPKSSHLPFLKRPSLKFRYLPWVSDSVEINMCLWRLRNFSLLLSVSGLQTSDRFGCLCFGM